MNDNKESFGICKIGKENRQGMANRNARYEPGPGAHNVDKYNLSHSYVFGTSTRAEKPKKYDSTPGPGHYKIPGTVA